MEQAENFRRAKFEWVSKFIPAPLGAWVCKICFWCGSIPAPGFPSQRSRCKIAFPWGKVAGRQARWMRGTVTGFAFAVGAHIVRP